MQRINQWIPSCLVGLVGLLECSQSAIAASPLLARLQAISEVGRGWGCSLTLVQKLQRIVHFREGTIRNTETIASDSQPSHGMMSDRRLPLPHTRALLSSGGLLTMGSRGDVSLPWGTHWWAKASISQPIYIHRWLYLSCKKRSWQCKEF